MTHVSSRKQLSLALSCAIALGAVVVPGAGTAQINPADTGYLTDRRDTVARSGFGLCWHTGTGPPVSTIECDSNVAPAPLARVEPAPRPVALAAVTPEAARVVPERVTLDADALFDFDKAVLRPAGRAALDDFVGKVKGIDPEMIVAVGHTDRFGSAAYNQRLSEQRVAAVKTYLVGKGIEADRIRAEGKGEAQPVTKAGECDGSQSAQVIACLQPDRRVEIEVVGTRLAR